MRLTTANLFDFGKPPMNRDRQDRQERFLRDELQPDVLCIQEFWHDTRDPDDRELAQVFTAFCDRLGMQGRLAWARCHVALLWNPRRAELRGWDEYELRS